jgi:hypothetical protein
MSEYNIKTLLNPIDSFIFIFPWEDTVTVKYDSVQRVVYFCKWDSENQLMGDELFSVQYIPANEQIEKSVDSSLLYTSTNGSYYYSITEAGQAFDITGDDVEASFISLN